MLKEKPNRKQGRAFKMYQKSNQILAKLEQSKNLVISSLFTLWLDVAVPSGFRKFITFKKGIYKEEMRGKKSHKTWGAPQFFLIYKASLLFFVIAQFQKLNSLHP